MHIKLPKWNQKTFGFESLKVLGPKIWNNLLYNINSSENLRTFKNLLKNWDGNLCKCNLYKKQFLLKSFILQYYLFSLF